MSRHTVYYGLLPILLYGGGSSEYGIPIPECLLMMLFGGVECESGEMDRVPERVSGA